MFELKEIGLRCKLFRIEQGYTQEQVAMEIGYTKENVSAFECGRNNNCRILMWYIAHGMNIDNIALQTIQGGFSNG